MSNTEHKLALVRLGDSVVDAVEFGIDRVELLLLVHLRLFPVHSNLEQLLVELLLFTLLDLSFLLLDFLLRSLHLLLFD